MTEPGTLAAIAIMLVLIVGSFSMTQLALAQQIAMDLTKPSGDKPYGGEKVGTVSITPKGHVLDIVANMSTHTVVS